MLSLNEQEEIINDVLMSLK